MTRDRLTGNFGIVPEAKPITSSLPFHAIERDLERLQQSLDNLNEQLTDQGRDQDKKLQTLRKEARQADDDLRGELRHTAERLSDEKVDRLALGELFIEMGNQLKAGGSLADMFKNLGIGS